MKSNLLYDYVQLIPKDKTINISAPTQTALNNTPNINTQIYIFLSHKMGGDVQGYVNESRSLSKHYLVNQQPEISFSNLAQNIGKVSS